MLLSLVRVRLGEPWPYRSVRPRTPPCHGENMGSNPIGAAILIIAGTDRYLVGAHNPDVASSTLAPATIILKKLEKKLDKPVGF